MPQDRIVTTTQWGEIPQPSVRVHAVVSHEGESGMWFYALDSHPIEKEVPVDFWLREAIDVDPNDWGSVGAFIDTWGIPVDLHNRDISGGEGAEAFAAEMGTLAEGFTLEKGRRRAATEIGLIEADVVPLRDRYARLDQYEMERAQSRRVFNFGEALLRVSRMRDFCRVMHGSHRADPGDYIDINVALSAFAPSLVPVGWTESVQEPTIYNICALQIANHVYSGLQILECANPTCKQKFTKQRGRAKYGAHRARGVLYHDATCARTVAQREYRRTRRQGGAKEGDSE